MKRTQITSWIKPAVSILIPLIVLLLPPESILPGLTVVEHRVLALFILAALFWILEPIPIFATSVVVIVLELLMVSDQGFILFRESGNGEEWTNLLDYQDIMNTFSSPVVLLILGGFFLAMGATKYRLDQNLAGVLLKPFGEKPAILLLGLMGITALFSMFMSNTATTAMMLSILVPILEKFDDDDPGKVAFTLGIPFAANIGGIGTPIGTPPNALALQYLTGPAEISFGEWMVFAVPYTVVLLAMAWWLLKFLFPFKASSVQLQLKTRFQRTPKANIVYVTFILTLALWLTDFWHGINSYIVALIPVGVFLSAGIIGKEDLKTISWDVLWLVAGGIALGMAMEDSGLAQRLVSSIPFEGLPAFLMLAAITLAALAMSNFMSNTGTANLLLPIVAALGSSGMDFTAIGGPGAMILAVALSVSLAMSLPVSSPPNALAYAMGGIKTGQMARAGVTIGLAGLAVTWGLMLILKYLNFFQP